MNSLKYIEVHPVVKYAAIKKKKKKKKKVDSSSTDPKTANP
jgi:hypothetical protein